MTRSGTLQIAQFVNSLTTGGAEVVALNLARGFASCGHICSVWGMCSDGELSARLAAAGIKSCSFGCPAGVSLATMARVGFRLKQERVDAIITHHFRQLFHALPVCRMFGTRIVHVEHDYHFFQRDPVSLRRLQKMIPFTHAFVGVSEEISQWFRRQMPDTAGRFVAIQNGVDINRFKPDADIRRLRRSGFGIADDEILIGTCARLEPVKNLELLLEAFSRSVDAMPRMKLMIVGDGSCRRDLEQLTHKLGIGGRVIFAGLQSNIEEYLPAFDIYALTSHNEGLPMSVLEAMASGLPIVATNVGALARVVGDSNGILLDEPSPDKVSCALSKLASNQDIMCKMGARSRTIVVEQYSDTVMVDQYLSLLQPN